MSLKNTQLKKILWKYQANGTYFPAYRALLALGAVEEGKILTEKGTFQRRKVNLCSQQTD
ncbi:hypothetical protein SOVF_177060 [Spinacia oleracea]|nr:hypothetical protein SOVF_177060 [Spinacia oleracea]